MDNVRVPNMERFIESVMTTLRTSVNGNSEMNHYMSLIEKHHKPINIPKKVTSLLTSIAKRLGVTVDINALIQLI